MLRRFAAWHQHQVRAGRYVTGTASRLQRYLRPAYPAARQIPAVSGLHPQEKHRDTESLVLQSMWALPVDGSLRQRIDNRQEIADAYPTDQQNTGSDFRFFHFLTGKTKLQERADSVEPHAPGLLLNSQE